MICKTHPDAPHGFMRNPSHEQDRYVCECEFWEEPTTVNGDSNMITLKQFFETFGYRITEGSEYSWSCYGPNAYTLDSWNGVHGAGGFAGSIIFDTVDQTVYETEVCDYTNNRAYRFINPEFAKAHSDEATQRSVSMNQAWDDVNFIDLEVEEDWLEKARAIVAGEEYDDRVQIQLTLDDDQLFEIMKLAHERDVTLNKMIETVIEEHIEQYEKNR
jgi:hypothetical protein